MDRFKTLNEWYKYEQINESVLDSIWTYIKNAINYSKYKAVSKSLLKKLYSAELSHKKDIYDIEEDGSEKITDMIDKKLDIWKETKRPKIVDKVGVVKADEMEKKLVSDLREAGKEKIEKDIEIKKSAFDKFKSEIEDKLNLNNNTWSMSKKQKGKASIYKQKLEAEHSYNLAVELAEYKGTKVSLEDEKSYKKKIANLNSEDKELDKKEEPIGAPADIPEAQSEEDDTDALKKLKAAATNTIDLRNKMVKSISELINTEVKWNISKENSRNQKSEDFKEEEEKLKKQVEDAKLKFEKDKEAFSKAKEAFTSALSGSGISDTTRDKFDAVKAAIPSVDELMSKKEELVKQATSDL
jgi:hypothetical protein